MAQHHQTTRLEDILPGRLGIQTIHTVHTVHIQTIHTVHTSHTVHTVHAIHTVLTVHTSHTVPEIHMVPDTIVDMEDIQTQVPCIQIIQTMEEVGHDHDIVTVTENNHHQAVVNVNGVTTKDQ